MSKTLSLSRRAHFFIKKDALFIKLQRAHNLDPKKQDFYIIKQFSVNQLKQIHDWTGKALKEMGESK